MHFSSLKWNVCIVTTLSIDVVFYVYFASFSQVLRWIYFGSKNS